MKAKDTYCGWQGAEEAPDIETRRRESWMKQSLIRMGAVVALVSLAATGWAETASRHITVTGEGRIDVEPDMATITLGVTNEAKEAKSAMAETSKAVAQMLAGLEQMGVAARDVQTQRFSLNPVWSNRNSSGNGRAEITGFVASNMVLVRVRDLDSLGRILDGVIADGANDFNGLQFGVQEKKPLEDAARKAAVEDGIDQARQLAEAAGVTLGPVVSISEQGSGGPRPMMMEMAAARDASAPIAAGEITLTKSVSMVFAIAE